MNEPALKALADFLSKSQATLSIIISMPGHGDLARSWNDVRSKLGLSGWPDEKEAEAALRRAFGQKAVKK